MTKQKQTPNEAMPIPGNLTSGTLRTFLVVGMLALVFMYWQSFVAVFVNILLWIYNLLGHQANSFGWAIILFTLLIRAVTWPLNAAQVKGAKAMQEFQNDKEWQEIQKKYAKDKEKLAQEQMRLMSERGISPFASCLPMLIQLPVLFGLYQSVNRALSATPLDMLTLARTVYSFQNVADIIPLNSKFLWMDLGRPEGIPMPFEVGFLPYGFPLLALIVALTTYLQSKLTMPPPTNPDDPSAMMSKQMAVMMPLMIGYFALTMPSGVSVYFLVSNVLGIVQYAATGQANWSRLLPGGEQQQTPVKKKK